MTEPGDRPAPYIPESLPPAEDELGVMLENLAAQARVSELPFYSRIPGVAWLRTRLNNIATRWYVLPIMAQQNEYNGALVRTLKLMLAQQNAQDVRVQELASLLQTNQAQFNSYQQTIQAQFQALNGHFLGINEQFAAIQAQFEALNGQFLGINNQFSGVQNEFTSVHDKVAITQSWIKGIETQFEDIQANLATVSPQFAGLKGEIENVQTTVAIYAVVTADRLIKLENSDQPGENHQ